MAQDFTDSQIIELKDTIDQLNRLIESLRKDLEESRQREAAKQEQIDYLLKKLFGRSSEKREEPIPGQTSLFDDPEDTDVDLSIIEAEEIKVEAHTRKPKRKLEDKFKGIPVEEIIIDDLSPEDKLCPECGTELVPIGTEYDHQELVIIKPEIKIIKYFTKTYGCPTCKVEAETPVFVKTKAPEPLIPHSYASVSAVSWTMYQKYVNDIPLYRQEKDWAQLGAELSRTTLGNWIIYCALNYFKPLYCYLHREQIKRKFLMADETRFQVLKEPDRRPQTQSFLWLYRTGEDGLAPIIVYEYTETRAKYNAKHYLRGFTGYLMTDGYQGYNDLPGIKRCACFAHIRRKFYEAIPKGKQLDFSQPAVQGVQFCDKLFYYERLSRERGDSIKQRYNRRLSKEKPVLEAFCKWLEGQKPAKGTRFYEAVGYALNRMPYMATYLEDGRCSLSNNLSENSIRPFTVGRKNWLFSDTQDGAEASAIVYTMVENAKAHDLNICQYLSYLLSQRPSETWTDDQLAEVAPWSRAVIDKCKNKL